MGTIEKTTCRICKDERVYFLGVGQLFGELLNARLSGNYSLEDNMLRRSMENSEYLRMQSTIKELDERPFISHENELLECKSCDISFLHYVVQFKYGEGQHFLSQPKCEKCSGLLKAAQKELSEYSCKSCGNALLECEVEGIWD
jgi:hypothetical protein